MKSQKKHSLFIATSILLLSIYSSAFSAPRTPEDIISELYRTPPSGIEFTGVTDQKSAKNQCDTIHRYFSDNLIKKNKNTCQVKNDFTRYPQIELDELSDRENTKTIPKPKIKTIYKQENYQQIRVTIEGSTDTYCLTETNGDWKITNVLMNILTPLSSPDCPYQWIKEPSDQDKQALPKKCWGKKLDGSPED